MVELVKGISKLPDRRLEADRPEALHPVHQRYYLQYRIGDGGSLREPYAQKFHRRCWAVANVVSIHVLPNITERAERGLCNMNSMMFEETVVSSSQTKLGNCFTSWLHGKIFKIIPPHLIGISLVSIGLKRDTQSFSRRHSAIRMIKVLNRKR
ncbi:hypothetical protein TNCV_2759011 [Trichonephila clavipes]|nr:hypothetical protein TNCV_2759011 [Trichonephila clavipes]